MKKEKDKSSFLFEDLPFFNLLFYSVVGLVCSAPVNHVLRRLAAAYADDQRFLPVQKEYIYWLPLFFP